MSELRAEAIAFSRAGQSIVAGVDLRLGRGELVGLIGPNGAGKSTLLRLLAGLSAPSHGRITVDGLDVATMPISARSRAIGYVPQHFNPAWDYTVRDLAELGSGRNGRPASVRTVLADNNLQSLERRRWSQLSGGERARTLLASVLAAPCPVLLADEPGANLDVAHRLALLARLRTEARGKTVVVVLHDLDLAARFCDRLVLMAAGSIVLDGTASAVVQDEALDRSFAIRFRRVPLEDGAVHLFPVAASSPLERQTDA